MPVVFDEIESTVVSDASRGQSTPAPGAGGNQGEQNAMTIEQMAMNLRRLARAQMRLAAD